MVCRIAEASGASAAVQCHHWSRGGRGSVELAQAVKKVASQKNHFQFLYNLQVRPDTIINTTNPDKVNTDLRYNTNPH